MKYFIKYYTHWMGTEGYEVIDAENKKDARIQAQELARDNYDSYSNLWEDDKEDTENDGFDWIDGEHYDYNIEEYNPEKHNMYLSQK